MEWISPNTSLTAEKRLPVPAFHLPSNSDYKAWLLSFRFLWNHQQHTPCASPFFYLYVYPSLFAGLSQLSLTSVAHDIAICYHPFQASMPFLVLFMCLSCLSLCQSFSISLHVVYHSPSQSPFVSLHSQCYSLVPDCFSVVSFGLPAAEYATCMYLSFCQQSMSSNIISSTRMSCSYKADITLFCFALMYMPWPSLLTTQVFSICPRSYIEGMVFSCHEMSLPVVSI